MRHLLGLLLSILIPIFAHATHYVVTECTDGSGGDVEISVNTTLSAAIQADNLIVDAGVVLNTNNFPILVRTRLTNRGTIQNKGSDAVAYNSGGSATAARVYKATIAGIYDSVLHTSLSNCGTARNGVNCSASSGGNAEAASAGGHAGAAGNSGGNGGDAGFFTGGIGGSAGAGGLVTNVGKYGWRYFLATYFGKYNASGTLASFGYHGGTSSSGCGGGGACGSAGSCAKPGRGKSGGASGANGGRVFICAKELDNQGDINADGGAGSDGLAGGNATYATFPCSVAAGGGGGGGCGMGGSGDLVMIWTHSVINYGNIHASAGANGQPGAGGKGIGGAKDGSAGLCSRSALDGAVLLFSL